MSDCLFCKIVAGEIPSEKVHETDHILAFRDINPQAPTHVLVIPKEHVVAVGSMTAEQQALTAALAASSAGPPTLHAVVAARGRGKSTALGQALACVQAKGLRVALCAPDDDAGAVAHAAGHGRIPRLGPMEALSTGPWDVLAIDEAARLPVPWLLALARRHPGTLWFATTTGGYEGTGQGFVQRVLATLEADPRPLTRHTLHAPIRWDAGDPLEAWLDDLLLASPPSATPGPPQRTLSVVSPQELADDEATLGAVHQLLQAGVERLALGH